MCNIGKVAFDISLCIVYKSDRSISIGPSLLFLLLMYAKGLSLKQQWAKGAFSDKICTIVPYLDVLLRELICIR